MAKASRSLDDAIRCLPGFDPFALASGFEFCAAEAWRWIDFIEQYCTFSQGKKKKQPFVLETWQKGVIANLFGWLDPSGLRRFREGLIYIPRKNGKSEMLAAIVCASLFLDAEPGAQLFSAASKRDQTKYVFEPVRQMITAHKSLRKLARDYRYDIRVEDRVYRAISSDALGEHGGSTHLAVIDELHAQPDRELVDVLETSMLERQQPLLLSITTADYARPSICNEKLSYAENVRDGVFEDPRFLPAIYCAAREDDPFDPRTWRKANPNLGVSYEEEKLRALAEKARRVPAFLNTFLRLNLNVVTDADVAWIPLHEWDACGAAPVALDELAGRECYAGLDLSTTTDLTALALVFPDGLSGIDVLMRFWVPEENAHRREQRDRVPYLDWIRRGQITATPGETVDYDRVRSDILSLDAVFDLRSIAVDRWQANQMMTQLQGEGLEVYKHGQGFASMALPCRELERLVYSRALRHGGHPVLRWMAGNTMVRVDPAGNQKPDKQKSTERIDGIVALLMAIGAWQATADDSQPRLIVG
ncbi:MAG: terminase large subunit [Planctomycetota bacterium]